METPDEGVEKVMKYVLKLTIQTSENYLEIGKSFLAIYVDQRRRQTNSRVCDRFPVIFSSPIVFAKYPSRV